MKVNSNILGEVERLDNSPFRYFLGELYGDNALTTMLPFGLPSPACDANVPSSGPPCVTHCGLLPRTTGITNMEDGKHRLDELQRTRISTWEPSITWSLQHACLCVTISKLELSLSDCVKLPLPVLASPT